MNILISNTNGTPIYDQIYSQIKAQIINGSLKEDEMLPSIRSLAKDLHISFITTKRAYEELEKDGFIYTVPGKGCFVSKRNLEFVKEEMLKEIEEHLSKVIELASSCSLSSDEIKEMIDLIMEEK